MYTIFMDLGNLVVKMETVESLSEAVWRCGLYFDKNPHNYFIRSEDGVRYSMFGTVID